MKRIIISAAAVICFLLQSTNTEAQLVVNIMPAIVVNQRPPMPAPDYIWIEPEWVWRGNSYVQVNGYWAAPRVGYYYAPGRWYGKPGAYYYKPGKWHGNNGRGHGHGRYKNKKWKD